MIYDVETPIEQLEGQTSSQLLTDGLGSVRATAGGSGTITSSESFLPFGAPEEQIGKGSVLGYTGALEGPDGLIYDQARYYDPATGGFTTPDTVVPNGEGTQGYGLYDYVADDPVTRTDPGGHLFSLAENSVVNGISNVLSNPESTDKPQDSR